jgi:L-fuconolactonase
MIEQRLVVDAHHHFWDPSRASYPWMTDDLAAIRRRFGPEDLRPLLEGAGVDRTILVQARSSLDETRELLAIAAATDFVAGVVGWVDLIAPDVVERIAELRSGPGGDKLVGIRHQVHDEPDPAWLGRRDVRHGLAALSDAGLVYDMLVRTRELPAALAVARDLGDLRLVIDHLAKPPIRDGWSDEWARRVAPLARLPNVHCKLSGLVTEADWNEWRVEDLAPYIRQGLDWFGPERCLFGSDWPVCLLASSYKGVLDACRHGAGALSAADREWVFGASAVRCYRLAVPVAGRRRH